MNKNKLRYLLSTVLNDDSDNIDSIIDTAVLDLSNFYNFSEYKKLLSIAKDFNKSFETESLLSSLCLSLIFSCLVNISNNPEVKVIIE